MPFDIIRNDITLVRADAIVNPANPQPVYANGTDRAIYMAAGEKRLLAARRRLGSLAPGQVGVTPGFGLRAKYILHAVGPVWQGGQAGEFELLRACYQRSLEKAAELKCRSIAFPLLATGINGFPKDQALQIALSAIHAFLMTHEMDVTLVVFSRDAFELSAKVFSDVSALIDDLRVEQAMRAEYFAPSAAPEPRPRGPFGRFQAPRGRREPDGRPDERCAMPNETPPEIMPCAAMPAAPAPAAKAIPDDPSDDDAIVTQLLAHKSETFQERLLHLIDASGMDDVEVYKRANIDRKHFSKIRSNRDYQPKKKTALAFAIALRLDLAQTRDLLSRAGWALSDARAFDVIVMYFIREQRYDVDYINATLFLFDQEKLGA